MRGQDDLVWLEQHRRKVTRRRWRRQFPIDVAFGVALALTLVGALTWLLNRIFGGGTA